jgi:hypothetical protein
MSGVVKLRVATLAVLLWVSCAATWNQNVLWLWSVALTRSSANAATGAAAADAMTAGNMLVRTTPSASICCAVTVVVAAWACERA